MPALIPYTTLTVVTQQQIAQRDPLTAIKPSDQTVNNSATLVNDSALFIVVPTSATIEFRLRLIYNSGATPGFKFHFTFPVGATASYTVHCSSGGAYKLFQNNDASTPSADGTGADINLLVFGEIFTGANSGNVTLQWAQATANASNTIVRANSSFIGRQAA